LISFIFLPPSFFLSFVCSVIRLRLPSFGKGKAIAVRGCGGP
jgi:hypothetical protein